MPDTVYDQMIGAGAPAIKPPFAYNIEAKNSRVLTIQVVKINSGKVATSTTMLSQRVVDLSTVAPEDVMDRIAQAATECWNEVAYSIGMDTIVNALTGTQTALNSRPAAPVPTLTLDPVTAPAPVADPVVDEEDPH